MNRFTKPLARTLMVILACIPLVFIPVTQDYYDTNKWVFICLTGILSMGILAVRAFVHTGAVSKPTPLVRGLLFLSAASFLSLFAVSTNKIEALLVPFGPLTFLALAMTAYAINSLGDQRDIEFGTWSIISSVSVIALISVYQFFGVGKVMLPQLSYLTDPLWNPTGSPVASFVLIIMIAPAVTSMLIKSIKHKHDTKTAALSIIMLVLISGICVTLYSLIGRIGSIVLPMRQGWAIMLEILKNPLQALFGVGSENFLAAFSSGRLPSYNLLPIWSVRFTTGSTWLLHMTTVNGLVGLLVCLYFLKTAAARYHSAGVGIAIYVGLAGLLFFPPNLTVFTMFVFLVSVGSLTHEQHKRSRRDTMHQAATIALVVTMVVSILSLYGLIRNYRAETVFFRSLRAAQANNGTETYNLQVAAIRTNPYISRYHLLYSQTNLAIATSLADSLATNKDATEENKAKDRQLVAQLIQQSIREAKLATSLNKSSVLAWENLARIYNQLVSIAQGSDQWAEAAYRQAITLDPVNPVLYLELGALSVQKKQYTDAVTLFQKSASLKQDYANAYYNLAFAYKNASDTQSALRAFHKTLELLNPESNDYKTVSDQISALSQSNPAAPTQGVNSATASSTLTTPAPIQTVTPVITLPPQAAPDFNP